MNDFDLDHIFTYHAPTEQQVEQYQKIRDAAKDFGRVIIENSPKSPDQSAAIRLLREAVMTVNAAIALDGRLHIQPATIDPNTYRGA